MSGDVNKVVTVWELATGKERLTFRGHSSLIYAVALSADSKWGASGCHNKEVRVWDAATGKERFLFKGTDDTISALAFHPDAGRSSPPTPGFHRAGVGPGKRREKPALKGAATEGVVALAVVSEGKRLVAVSSSGLIEVWDLENARKTDSWKIHQDWVKTAAVSADGKTVVAFGRDKPNSREFSTRVFDLTTGKRGATCPPSGASCSASRSAPTARPSPAPG